MVEKTGSWRLGFNHGVRTFHVHDLKFFLAHGDDHLDFELLDKNVRGPQSGFKPAATRIPNL